ncbi:hypothetical protein [Xanthocytophaga agilis]|uniref:Uncharacterized protein n=1 Tax=Xanthocytophaga agilis TaxID=3048010 RepID=A0AAE3R8T2_9BACT|nr:hypothetical protein [Xanthocytophaga agilis]MDJ1503545.1 hypothetical protein [Xanthocytophaga agilis]
MKDSGLTTTQVPKPPKKSDKFNISVLAAIFELLLLVIGLIIITSNQIKGRRLFDQSSPEQVREIFNLYLDFYSSLTDIILTSFGAIAFLVTYQGKSEIIKAPKTLISLTTSIVCLSFALIANFLCKEVLLLMIQRNAVDFSLDTLNYGRWFIYSCLIIAILSVAFFIKETTFHTQ